MGLGAIGFDAELISARIRQVGERALRGGANVLREEAKEIADLARSFAPVDEGNLEDAIEVNPHEERDGNRRVSVEVWVNPDAPGSGGEEFAISYGMRLHEQQEPFGSGAIPLGVKSRIKDVGRGVVGGKFMERAANARRSMLGKKLMKLYRRMFK